jgi:hypothetical protein
MPASIETEDLSFHGGLRLGGGGGKRIRKGRAAPCTSFVSILVRIDGKTISSRELLLKASASRAFCSHPAWQSSAERSVPVRVRNGEQYTVQLVAQANRLFSGAQPCEGIREGAILGYGVRQACPLNIYSSLLKCLSYWLGPQVRSNCARTRVTTNFPISSSDMESTTIHVYPYSISSTSLPGKNWACVSNVPTRRFLPPLVLLLQPLLFAFRTPSNVLGQNSHRYGELPVPASAWPP